MDRNKVRILNCHVFIDANAGILKYILFLKKNFNIFMQRFHMNNNNLTEIYGTTFGVAQFSWPPKFIQQWSGTSPHTLHSGGYGKASVRWNKRFSFGCCSGQIKHKRFAFSERNGTWFIRTCNLCILHRPKTTAHLFLRCNFAKACWATIGIQIVTTWNISLTFNRMRQHLGVPFFMEIIYLDNQEWLDF